MTQCLPAHLDAAQMTCGACTGASDCASCVGVALEAARVIAADPSIHLAAPLVFLLNGGEETFSQVQPLVLQLCCCLGLSQRPLAAPMTCDTVPVHGLSIDNQSQAKLSVCARGLQGLRTAASGPLALVPS